MKTKRIKIYKFNELSEKAKEKAIEELSDINADYDWWESTYDDAKEIGLKITSFDIGRGSYCNGDFIDIADEVASKIINSHGKMCETYKTAQNYLSEVRELLEISTKEYNEKYNENSTIDKDEDIPLLDEFFDDNYSNEMEDLESEFKKSLLEDYRIMLEKEYEYLNSREAIIETIEANDYEFLEDGTRSRF